jgi:hypothetical protein
MDVTLNIDRSKGAGVNFDVLRRSDPAVEEIIASLDFCAIYEFNQTTQSWVRGEGRGGGIRAQIVSVEVQPSHTHTHTRPPSQAKKNIEGPLFVVRR